MGSRSVAFLLKVVALMPLAAGSGNASEWGIVGAGNAECRIWHKASTSTKTEVLSWVQGFATAENLNRSASGQVALRLDLLTQDYLNYEISAACASPKNADKTMVGIAIKILSNFPTVNLRQP